MNPQTIAAKHLLTAQGWLENATVQIGEDGRIASVSERHDRHTISVGALLPAPGNVHSHAFQRAMAGLAEGRGAGHGADDFWSWRTLMYSFVERLTPDDIEAIAAQVQMETLEAGYASIGEFHYLHHQPDGAPYANISELSERIFAAAEQTGIGYTHFPVFYMRGGMDDRAPEGGQKRFACTTEQFAQLFDRLSTLSTSLADDARLGVAPHSIRAVDAQGLAFVSSLQNNAPVHIHIAEQTGEVEEAMSMLGARPVEWLLDNADINACWSLVHATHMNGEETKGVARTGAVAALCPVTEANLGDGVFDAPPFLNAGGRIAVGTDSNVRISLSEELRMLEYSQRLHRQQRVLLADDAKSAGRFIFDHVSAGGAQSLGRDAGRIETGALADLVAIDSDNPVLTGFSGDRLLDAWIFAGDDGLVTDVWSAGRHVVRSGRHIERDAIANRFNKVMSRLRSRL
ncbi:MAG: formimidoylglutamate deiminase [Pseudomonadota bacterium]